MKSSAHSLNIPNGLTNDQFSYYFIKSDSSSLQRNGYLINRNNLTCWEQQIFFFYRQVLCLSWYSSDSNKLVPSFSICPTHFTQPRPICLPQLYVVLIWVASVILLCSCSTTSCRAWALKPDRVGLVPTIHCQVASEKILNFSETQFPPVEMEIKSWLL